MHGPCMANYTLVHKAPSFLNNELIFAIFILIACAPVKVKILKVEILSIEN